MSDKSLEAVSAEALSSMSVSFWARGTAASRTALVRSMKLSSGRSVEATGAKSEGDVEALLLVKWIVVVAVADGLAALRVGVTGAGAVS